MDSAAGGAAATVAGSPAGDSSPAEVDATAEISLLKTLADREETLLEMARIAVTRREQLAVSEEARRILAEQRRESNRVLGMLKGEFQTTHRPTVTDQEQVLVDTLNASGAGEFDRIYLGVVVKHHEDDIKLIDAALPRIKHPGARELVTSIRQQRAADAATLKKKLAALPSGT
jgi:uncharacterized protein (DUF305 family)